jgi:hypothetical protein
MLVPCFTRTTRILTLRGERKIDTLRAGDTIQFEIGVLGNSSDLRGDDYKVVMSNGVPSESFFSG